MGDAIEAVIAANYYFGGPVTDKVTFKVRDKDIKPAGRHPVHGTGCMARILVVLRGLRLVSGLERMRRLRQADRIRPQEVVQEQTVAIDRWKSKGSDRDGRRQGLVRRQ